MVFRKLLKREKGEETEVGLPEEQVLIEEANDEYVLLKAFMSKNPEVAFSYAINRIDELRVEVSSLDKEKKSLEELNTALQDDLEEAFRFKEQMEDMKTELMDKERELSEKSVEIDTLVRKSAKLGVDNEALQEKMKKKEKQIGSYLEQMEKLKHSSKVIHLEKKDKLSQNKIASLEEDLKTLRIQTEEQKDALSMQEEELNQYKQTAVARDEELNTLKANWWEANTQVKEVKRQLEEKVSIMASKEEMIKNLMLKSKRLTLEMDAVKKEVEEKKTILSDYEKRHAEAEKKEEEFTKQIEEKNKHIEELDEKVTEAIEKGPKLLEAQKRIEELAPLEGEVKQLRVSLEEQKDAISVATSDADLYKQMAASMDEELNSLKANWWEADKQVKSLKEEIELKASIIDMKDNNIKELTKKSRSMTAEFEMLKRQIAERNTMDSGTAATTPPQPTTPPATEAVQETPAPKIEEPPAPSKVEEPPETPQAPTAPPATEAVQETPAPRPMESPFAPAPEPTPKTEEPAATRVETPPADMPAPKVSPNNSKIKLLEIEKRSILKMMENPKIKGSPLEKNYQEKLNEIFRKIGELRQG